MERERERDKKTIYIYIQTRLLSVLAGPFKGLNYFDRKPYNGVTLPPIPLYDSSTISRRVCLPSGEAKKKLFTMASFFRFISLVPWLTMTSCYQWDFQGPPIMGPLTHNIPIPLP